MDEYRPVCWFKHGPYEGDEPLQVVFDDPRDEDCFSPLHGGPVAEAAPELLALVVKLRQEFAGLPHSLGYDFTHLPEVDALLARLGIGAA